MFHYQKWQSGPTPNPFQTDPLLYGTYYWSSGFKLPRYSLWGHRGKWDCREFHNNNNKSLLTGGSPLFEKSHQPILCATDWRTSKHRMGTRCPVQTDPPLYGTGQWSSGLEMGVWPMSQGTWRTHRFAPKNKSDKGFIIKNGNPDQRRIHSKRTRYSTERTTRVRFPRFVLISLIIIARSNCSDRGPQQVLLTLKPSTSARNQTTTATLGSQLFLVETGAIQKISESPSFSG